MYRYSSDQSAVIRQDGAVIPIDVGNFDYQAVEEWVAAGGVIDPPAVAPYNQAAALQRTRDMRKPILDALAGIGLAALAGGDASTVQAVLAARQGLLDITKDAGVLAATDDVGFDAAVLIRYHQLVAQAPAMVVRAFTEAAT